MLLWLLGQCSYSCLCQYFGLIDLPSYLVAALLNCYVLLIVFLIYGAQPICFPSPNGEAWQDLCWTAAGPGVLCVFSCCTNAVLMPMQRIGARTLPQSCPFGLIA